MKTLLSLFLLITLSFGATAQPEDLTQIWPAHWIKAADGPEKEFGVFYFRKKVEMETVPEKLMVHTSGDNRYQLFVNGELAVWGPQRGDLDHWKYESTDIAPMLQVGENTLAAVVWNYGAYPPDAQFTVQTAFILAAGDQQFRSFNTNKSWKAIQDLAYAPIPVDKTQVSGYFGAGSTERVDAAKRIWGWASPDFDESGWEDAVQIETGKARTCIWAGRWKLEPRAVAMETLTPQRFAAVRIAEGVEVPDGFPQQPAEMVIPANSKIRLVFDQGHETTAFPQLEMSGGKGASIRMKYVEAPYEAGGLKTKQKGNRNEVEGKEFLGVYDEYTADGSDRRVHQPLWWRAFRYVEMTVETQGQPLTLHDYRSVFNTYPFERKARLETSGSGLPTPPSSLEKMLEVGERTVRLCSHETYMDCPYYEQTQFEGDTRVQALISYYHFGEAALAKNAIEQFDWSRNEQGFLSARYPANSTYYIPNFSIFWVGMLYDYMLHVGERDFIRQKIQGVRTVLHYFLERRREDGTIQRPDFHNFVDWAFPRGEAPFDEAGRSALVDLHVLMALQWATALEEYAGDAHFAGMCAHAHNKLRAAIKNQYWSEEKELFADIPTGSEGEALPFSIHTNSMAVLTGVVEGEDARALMRRALQAEGLTQPTVYWHFYLFEALDAAGLGDEYLANTGIWQEMLAAGCTTWPETGLQSRSECHGWGASPNYHLYKTMLGIRPAAPGFQAVTIAPHPNGAEQLSGQVPTPQGPVSITLTGLGKPSAQATITLPEGVTGTLVWEGKEYRLRGGEQRVGLGE